MILKTGQSFSIYGVAYNYDQSKLPLGSFTITARLKGATHTLQLTPVKLAGAGEFRLDGILTDHPADNYKMDVKFVSGSMVDYSKTEVITVQEAITL